MRLTSQNGSANRMLRNVIYRSFVPSGGESSSIAGCGQGVCGRHTARQPSKSATSTNMTTAITSRDVNHLRKYSRLRAGERSVLFFVSLKCSYICTMDTSQVSMCHCDTFFVVRRARKTLVCNRKSPKGNFRIFSNKKQTVVPSK